MGGNQPRCALRCGDDRDLQDAIDRADGALYGAKTSGRNRVQVSLPSTLPAATVAD